jgi:hypothetical protein
MAHDERNIRHYALVPLRRYWIEFAPSDAPLETKLGCGVTGFDRDDALRLLAEALGVEPPAPTRVVEDVDVSALDPGHVLPNMYPPSERGVWFPMLTRYR